MSACVWCEYSHVKCNACENSNGNALDLWKIKSAVYCTRNKTYCIIWTLLYSSFFEYIKKPDNV